MSRLRQRHGDENVAVISPRRAMLRDDVAAVYVDMTKTHTLSARLFSRARRAARARRRAPVYAPLRHAAGVSRDAPFERARAENARDAVR